jgi:hypothetical protein
MEHHIYIIVMDIRVEKQGYYIQLIHVASTSPGQLDEISKGV